MGLEKNIKLLHERLATTSNDLAAKIQEAQHANDEASSVRSQASDAAKSLKKLQAVEKELNDTNTILRSQVEEGRQRIEEQDREIAELMAAASSSRDRANGESLADEMSRKNP